MTNDEIRAKVKLLANTTDAMVWAEEFCRIFNGEVVGGDGTGEAVVDEGLMVGWFANAMAVAEREGKQSVCPHAPEDVFNVTDDMASCRKCGILMEALKEMRGE